MLRNQLSNFPRSRFEQWLDNSHEVGGAVQETSDGRLEFVPLSDGKDENEPWTIEIPSSEIMFHTHPLGCPDKNRHDLCGYGVPSSRDLQQFLREKKSSSHVIVSHDGLYLMENMCKKGRRKPRRRKRKDKFISNVHALEEAAKEPGQAYGLQDYTDLWWAHYRQDPPDCIDVTHIPFGS